MFTQNVEIASASSVRDYLLQANVKAMKKVSKIQRDHDGLGMYDLSNGIRGKYAGRVSPQSRIVIHGKPHVAYRVSATKLRSSSRNSMEKHFLDSLDLFPEDFMPQRDQPDTQHREPMFD